MVVKWEVAGMRAGQVVLDFKASKGEVDRQETDRGAECGGAGCVSRWWTGDLVEISGENWTGKRA